MSDLSQSYQSPVSQLHNAMRHVLSSGGSDIHLKTGNPPYIRVRGDLEPVPGSYTLAQNDMETIVRELCSKAPQALNEFSETGDADLAYQFETMARFRVNVFRKMGEIGIVLRAIPMSVPRFDELGVPSVVKQLADINNGLVLVTGATGSGKTTTLASLLDIINEKYPKHIITIEDPVEIVHQDKTSVVNQREVGSDTASFKQALRRSLRQDPDVILVGEMRDPETVQTAISAAETGHLVFSTLHTIDVMETIHRILDFFPPELERQARAMLASTLRGVVSQRLIKTSDGKRRVPAAEVMIGTARIAEAITNPDKTGQIEDMIKEGSYYGMQTFDQALLRLVKHGDLTPGDALQHSNTRQNFALMLEAEGIIIEKQDRAFAAGDAKAYMNEEELEERLGSANEPDPAQYEPPAPPPPPAPNQQQNPPAA